MESVTLFPSSGFSFGCFQISDFTASPPSPGRARQWNPASGLARASTSQGSEPLPCGWHLAATLFCYQDLLEEKWLPLRTKSFLQRIPESWPPVQ